MKPTFYATMSRMKYIPRWTMMYNVRTESLYEHTAEVAVLAHALAAIENSRFGGSVDAGKCVLLALYHDMSEILTGDLPTPVKYHDEKLRDAYKQVEREANERLLQKLPENLQGEYAPLLLAEESVETKFVKAADKLSALIKCVEELKMGNREFVSARKSTEKALKAMDIAAVDCFIKEFMPAYEMTLDEQEAQG